MLSKSNLEQSVLIFIPCVLIEKLLAVRMEYESIQNIMNIL